MSEDSKFAGYKINTQKSLALIYTNNEKTERKIKEIIPFTIVTQRIKQNKFTSKNKRPIYRKLRNTDERNQR